MQSKLLIDKLDSYITRHVSDHHDVHLILDKSKNDYHNLCTVQKCSSIA